MNSRPIAGITAAARQQGSRRYRSLLPLWCCPLLSNFNDTPFSRRSFLAIMRKHDFFHETGSRPTYQIATPPEEDRAMAMGNMHKSLAKIGLM